MFQTRILKQLFQTNSECLVRVPPRHRDTIQKVHTVPSDVGEGVVPTSRPSFSGEVGEVLLISFIQNQKEYFSNAATAEALESHLMDTRRQLVQHFLFWSRVRFVELTATTTIRWCEFADRPRLTTMKAKKKLENCSSSMKLTRVIRFILVGGNSARNVNQIHWGRPF